MLCLTVGFLQLAMPMTIASSVTSGHRCMRTHSYVEPTLYGKLRRDIFELIKENYILKIHFGTLQVTVLKAFPNNFKKWILLPEAHLKNGWITSG